MTISISCALFWALAPLFILWAVLSWATESQPQRIRRWHRQGISQQRIADRLGVSRYRVRLALA